MVRWTRRRMLLPCDVGHPEPTALCALLAKRIERGVRQSDIRQADIEQTPQHGVSEIFEGLPSLTDIVCNEWASVWSARIPRGI